MSTPTYRIPAKARALLLERDMTVQRLADESGVPHQRVLRVLASHPRASRADAVSIAPHLCPSELQALGWFEPGGLMVVEQPEKLPVEQFRKAS
jgi:hypothetical protein